MHIPVLQKEVIKYLNPQPGENFIDCTFGEGGHSRQILEETAPKGKILGIDLQQRVKIRDPRLILVEDNYANLKEIVQNSKFFRVKGILLDLGMSSWHLEDSGRGFSFKKKEPLDMRYDPRSPLKAEKIINYSSKFEIERILREFGEEKRWRLIAEKIVSARALRPLSNTWQLAEIVRQSRGDEARVFQALRIAVNGELENLQKVLPQAMEILESGGRLAVISFHSLEDRIVKNFFKNQPYKILTKKPVVPGPGEIRENFRARSAKLRVIKKQPL